MKIGIITQPLGNNYGGILQNYALQTILKRMDFIPLTLRIGKVTVFDWIISCIRVILLRILGKNATLPNSPYKSEKMALGLESFIKKNILTTKCQKWFSEKQLKDLSLDCIIVGSDQVWRPIYNRKIEDMFLKFAARYNINKISYAASFGTNEWEFNDKQTKDCKLLINKFSAVSVREKSAINLCKTYLDTDATLVLDPTLLLNQSDYDSLCSFYPSQNNDYILAYVLDMSKQKLEFIKKFANINSLKSVILEADIHLKESDTVEKWLGLFKNARFIITDSYHGTIFSIIYKKDFIAFNNINRGNSRMISILNLLGLEDRLVSTYDTVSSYNKINWNNTYKVLDHYKDISISFLRNNLKNF